MPTTIRRFRLALALAALVALATMPAAGQQQATGRAFEPQDWYKVRTLGSPAMSPDGNHVAVQVTTVVESENKRLREIWVVPTVGGDPVRFSAPGIDSSSPSFSDDGSLLIFTAEYPGQTTRRWAVRMDRVGGEFPYTGPSEEPAAGPGGGRQGGPGGGGGGAASRPKDNSFVVTTGVEGQRRGGGPGQGRGGPGRGGAADDDPYAKMEPMAKPPSNSVTRPLHPERFDGMHITDMRYKANGRGFIPSTGAAGGGRGGGQGGDADDQPPAQILVDRLDGNGPKAVTDTAYSHRNASVSPDGRLIAFVADAELRPDDQVRTIRDEIAELGTPQEREAASRDRLSSDIFVIPATGGEPKRIPSPGNDSNLRWSSDSRYLAFNATMGPFTGSDVFVADVAAATTRNLTGELRADPGGLQWLDNGQMLLQLNVGGRNALVRVDPRTGEQQEVLSGRRRMSGFTYDEAKTKMAYVATSVDRPTELFVANVNGTGERQLTKFNEALNTEIAWSPAERFTYTSVDDFEIEAWLMKPHGYEEGKKYPLVLYIHGGPHSAYGEGWFDEFQNIAGAGMWVLFTNPRGSSGYGGAFTFSTRGRWGYEDYEDLMKAVDIAAARPDVDETRMGVTGGSYGGFMTAWITTKTDRFRAAQTDRMISNWVSWYGISDAQSLTEGEFFGNPWQNWDLYIELSPIRYADKVKTPTLIVQSEEDHRTPMADAEQWFMALKKHDVPVEFIRYPRSTHDLSRTGEPWLLTDRLNRLRQWFSHYLKDDADARIHTDASARE
jgi:dipeptidyl aminopeptidase/acylaminoacyl peptidase